MPLAGEVLHPLGNWLRSAGFERRTTHRVANGDVDRRVWTGNIVGGVLERMARYSGGRWVSSLPCLPATSRQPAIKAIHPPQRHRYQVLIVKLVSGDLLHTLGTKRNVVDLPAFEPAKAPRLCLGTSILGVVTAKQLFHLDALHDPFFATHQTSIATAVPEAPAKTDALVTTEDNLAAHLAHGKVEQRAVTGLARETGAAANGSGRGDGRVMRAPAEGAKVGRWIRL